MTQRTNGKTNDAGSDLFLFGFGSTKFLLDSNTDSVDVYFDTNPNSKFLFLITYKHFMYAVLQEKCCNSEKCASSHLNLLFVMLYY
jgi:hypothetical protein